MFELLFFHYKYYCLDKNSCNFINDLDLILRSWHTIWPHTSIVQNIIPLQSHNRNKNFQLKILLGLKYSWSYTEVLTTQILDWRVLQFMPEFSQENFKGMLHLDVNVILLCELRHVASWNECNFATQLVSNSISTLKVCHHSTQYPFCHFI
jgi:hypothetical protein